VSEKSGTVSKEMERKMTKGWVKFLFGLALLAFVALAGYISQMTAFAYSVPDSPANNLISHEDAWFYNGIDGWNNPSGGWTLSVNGYKNPCPASYCDGAEQGHAAKLGPTRTTGNATEGVWHTFYLQVPSDGAHTAVNFQMWLIMRSYDPMPNELILTISGSNDGQSWTPVFSQLYTGDITNESGSVGGYTFVSYDNIPSPNYAFYEIRFDGLYYDGNGSLGMKVSGISLTTNAADGGQQPTPTAVPSPSPTVPPVPTATPTAVPQYILQSGETLALLCADGTMPTTTIVVNSVEVHCP
ncbi:MAG: hypothetical protein D6706_15730, partial [Chloroflexi bacterium]